MSTWKSTDIGGLDQAFCIVVLVLVASAVKVMSDCPCMRGILIVAKGTISLAFKAECSSDWAHFHTIMLSAAMYFALPSDTLQSTLAVFKGVGIFKLTLVAASFEEKVVRI